MKRRYFFWDKVDKTSVNFDKEEGTVEVNGITIPKDRLVYHGSLPVNVDGTLASESDEEWKKKV